MVALAETTNGYKSALGWELLPNDDGTTTLIVRVAHEVVTDRWCLDSFTPGGVTFNGLVVNPGGIESHGQIVSSAHMTSPKYSFCIPEGRVIIRVEDGNPIPGAPVVVDWFENDKKPYYRKPTKAEKDDAIPGPLIYKPEFFISEGGATVQCAESEWSDSRGGRVAGYELRVTGPEIRRVGKTTIGERIKRSGW